MVPFVVNMLPYFLSSIDYYDTTGQNFNPNYLLNSYHEITTAPTLYDGLRLLGYSGHPYSYQNIGTLNDSLYIQTLSSKILDGQIPNLLANPAFESVIQLNESRVNGSSYFPTDWDDLSGNCDNHNFLCEIVNITDKGVVEGTDEMTSNNIINFLPHNIFKISTNNTDEAGQKLEVTKFL